MEDIMKTYLCREDLNNNKIMEKFCLDIKNKVDTGDFDTCFKLVYKLMADFPHSPVPHNLLGILFEIKGNHLLAMKHLRAAMALDPSYRPASENLSEFANSFMTRTYFYL